MNLLADEDSEKFNTVFSVAIKNGIKAEDLEGLWASVHEKIRAESKDDLLAKNRDLSKLGSFKVRASPKDVNAVHEKKFFKAKSLTLAERKEKIKSTLNKRDELIAARKAELEALAKANEAAEASESESDDE